MVFTYWSFLLAINLCVYSVVIYYENFQKVLKPKIQNYHL